MTTPTPAALAPLPDDCLDCGGTTLADDQISACPTCRGAGHIMCATCWDARAVERTACDALCVACLVERRSAAERSPAVQAIVETARLFQPGAILERRLDASVRFVRAGLRRFPRAANRAVSA